ncbi:MAG: hypothetical protein IJL69_00870 [Oscillospiraceae bacterium]|nr:hypothetical protein [Oscillospiraceae bacterium]
MDCGFNEDLIRITRMDVLGKLPDPFRMEDGTIADTPEKWAARRKEIYRTAVELQYGTQPPEPEFLEVEMLHGYEGKRSGSYRVTTGTRAHPVSFWMRIFAPEHEGKVAAIVDGDLSFGYAFDKEWMDAALSKDVALVLFDRTELARDIIWDERGHGPLYETYPEYTFGALGAWAWGYSRCVDALEKLGGFDMDLIAFSGHSRGGKTVALAGALDTRVAFVNPNETCAGACGCYRVHMSEIQEDGREGVSETLADLWKNFAFWVGPGMEAYTQREQDLPFDCHFLKAMVAPRVLVIGEAASDTWANPVGSWLTTEAAKEVWKLWGREDNVMWYFRKGYHGHKAEDVEMLVNAICVVRDGAERDGRFGHLPFRAPEKIWDWSCPAKR